MLSHSLQCMLPLTGTVSALPLYSSVDKEPSAYLGTRLRKVPIPLSARCVSLTTESSCTLCGVSLLILLFCRILEES